MNPIVWSLPMVLNHLGMPIEYKRLSRLFRVGPSFTPFTNLRYLDTLGLSVVQGKEGDISIFAPDRNGPTGCCSGENRRLAALGR